MCTFQDWHDILGQKLGLLEVWELIDTLASFIYRVLQQRMITLFTVIYLHELRVELIEKPG